MPSTVEMLVQKGLAKPPRWLPDNIMYETIMGSMAYGVSSDSSDMDIYGFCIPPKSIVFPHLAGEIMGFGTPVERFNQWQQHHMADPDALKGSGRVYDCQIYNIVKYFQLCMENNPNMIDSMFTPINCVLHSTNVGNMVRERRKIFLHKRSWHTFKGYAYSQLHKMSSKDPQAGSKRQELREQFGFDVKFAYHVVRLILEAEQILAEGDLDLQRHHEQLKAIRRGEWTEQQIRDFFTQKEKGLEKLYEESKIPHSPDEAPIKQLLLDCLEEHYGSLGNCVVNTDKATAILQQIKALIEKSEA